MVRNLSVGLVALATLTAAAGLVWRRRRLTGVAGAVRAKLSSIEPLYSAGL